jgi:hypothetical protein
MAGSQHHQAHQFDPHLQSQSLDSFRFGQINLCYLKENAE